MLKGLFVVDTLLLGGGARMRRVQVSEAIAACYLHASYSYLA